MKRITTIAASLLIFANSPAGACGFMLSAEIDAHTQAGQSDAAGDRKGGELLARCGRNVFAIRGAIVTPQEGRGPQHDTGMLGLTYGREGQDWGVYATAGWINGWALDGAHQLVDKMHGLSGRAAARQSPASSPSRPLLSLGGRYDVSARAGFFGLQATPFARAGTDVVEAGAALTAFLAAPGANFLATVPGMPQPAVDGTALYLTGLVKVTGYDAATSHPQPVQAALTAGVQAKLGRSNAVAGIAGTVRLTCEVQDCSRRPVALGRVYLGWRLP